MNNKYVISDIRGAIQDQDFPTVTAWNRLEARPRTHSFERTLKAEIRDALWMLTRQWQMGEFRGEDVGSPVQAKLHMSITNLTHYRPANQDTSEPISDVVPLEAQVERVSIPFLQVTEPNLPVKQKLSLDLRLLMGRQWLKMLRTVTTDPKDQNAYIQKYNIEMPDPDQIEFAQICAHPEVWANLAAVAGRLMDGAELYFYLASTTSNETHLASDEITLADPTHTDAVNELGQAFRVWFQRLFYQPSGPDRDAWLPERLEYQFAVSAQEKGHQRVLKAEEYHHGRLDWYAFDFVSGSLDPEGTDESTTSNTPGSDTKTFLPTQIVFDGSPNTRWWTFEDHRSNFGDIKPDTTDLAKLILLEFGLVYANDWFLVPHVLPAGVIAQIQGMSVTNVFGERFWIEAAGSGADDAWQRWNLFTLNTKGEMDERADTRLLLLPTVPKIQEGKPREQVTFIRDELSNMVWGIEKIISLASGESKPGAEAAIELRAYLLKPLTEKIEELRQRKAQLESKSESMRTPAEKDELSQVQDDLAKLLPPASNADIRYQIMNTVPEHWIPFIPVHVDQNNREIQLQRAALPRILEGDPNAPKKVRPRTSLLREGLDQAALTAYYVHEEEVPRAGIQVTVAFQRTRARDGRVWVWLGIQKQAGRGEGSSGLAFDQLVNVEKPVS